MPIAAAQLALTPLSGAIYGTILYYNIDTSWPLRLQTGNFGIVNLQPLYSPLMELFTLILIGSGIAMFMGEGRAQRQAGD